MISVWLEQPHPFPPPVSLPTAPGMSECFQFWTLLPCYFLSPPPPWSFFLLLLVPAAVSPAPTAMAALLMAA